MPKKRVSALASPANRSSATRLSWNAVHCVAIATRNTRAAISRRYGLPAIWRIASRSGSRLDAIGRVTTLRRMRVLAADTITAADTMRTNSTSSMFTAPPTGSTR